MQPIVHLCQTPVLERVCPRLQLPDLIALTLVCRRLRDAVSPLIGARFILRSETVFSDEQFKLLLGRFHPRRLHVISMMQFKVGQLPDYLKELILLDDSIPPIVAARYWTVPLDVGILPSGLEHLELGLLQNQVFVPGVLPASLRQLRFGLMFNSPLVAGVLPPNLVSLTFGYCFNKPLDAGVLPDSLEELRFGDGYNQPICVGVLPSSLKKLVFGDAFNQPIEVSVLPPALKVMKFGIKFKQSLRGDHILPDSLEELELGPYYNWALTARVAALLYKTELLRKQCRQQE